MRKSPLPFTKFGDKGNTMLANGDVVKKTSLRVTSIGDIDELNSSIGNCYDFICNSKNINKIQIHEEFEFLQDLLFVAGSDVATPLEDKTEFRINEKHIKWIEERIENYHQILEALKQFILPNNPIHFSRSICRRAERSCIHAKHFNYGINENLLIFLNRVSDYLFTIARLLGKDKIWDKKSLYK